MFRHKLDFHSIDLDSQELFKRLFPNLIETQGCIIIFGHYRSGSTALTSLISLIKYYSNFGELLEEDHVYEDRDRIKATELLKNNDFFVFNVKPRYYYRLPVCFANNSVPNYKIKLTRTNILDQLTSLCIQTLDDKSGVDPRSKPEYDLNLRIDIIRRCIYSYIDYQVMHDNTSIKFDAEVTYEDVKPLLKYSNITPAWRPQNYDKLYEIVEKEYQLAVNRLSELNFWINNLGN